jgi:hypothetical protein
MWQLAMGSYILHEVLQPIVACQQGRKTSSAEATNRQKTQKKARAYIHGILCAPPVSKAGNSI